MEAPEMSDLARGGSVDDVPVSPPPSLPPPRQEMLRLMDAAIAAQDVLLLNRVVKLMSAMSQDGQRAALCWLLGYFDTDVTRRDNG